MFKFLTKVFDPNDRTVKRYHKMAEKIDALAEEMAKLSDEELQAKTEFFKARFAKGEKVGS
mgnify:FL=1